MVTDAWVPSMSATGVPNTLVCEWPSAYEADKELTVRYGLEFCVEFSEYSTLNFVVPLGFKTDLASDPLDRRGTWDYGSVVHDYLYVVNGIVGNTVFSRKDCDDIFYYIMQQCLPKNASIYMKLKNKVTWLAVRLFGAKAWNT